MPLITELRAEVLDGNVPLSALLRVATTVRKSLKTKLITVTLTSAHLHMRYDLVEPTILEHR